jgi:putative endonuclease
VSRRARAPGAGSGSPKASSFEAGRAGEEAVARILAAEGWQIVARNWRGPRGEIDLVAHRDGTLAFVEVKHWKGFGAEELGRAVGRAKRRRIVETAKIFLAQYREYSNATVRFDIFLLKGEGKAHRIESAFTGEL